MLLCYNIDKIKSTKEGFKMMRVENMVSERSGREVANQFIITDEYKIKFQSYASPIVQIDIKHKIIYVYNNWDYSVTTGKYRNQFMYNEGFIDMANKKGFEYYMNLGAIGDYDIIKVF